MAIDSDRNRVLAALRDQPEGADSSVLSERLTRARESVERHLLYCADCELAKWRSVRNGLGQKRASRIAVASLDPGRMATLSIA